MVQGSVSSGGHWTLYHEYTCTVRDGMRPARAKGEDIHITSISNLQCLHRESSGRRSQESSPWSSAGFLLLREEPAKKETLNVLEVRCIGQPNLSSWNLGTSRRPSSKFRTSRTHPHHLRREGERREA